MITKFDFFQDLNFKLYFWVLDIHSTLKMCTFEIYHVAVTQKMSKWKEL